MSKSMWHRADEFARRAAGIDLVSSPALLEEMAVMFRDLCEMAGLRNEGIDHPLRDDHEYEITLKVKAHIIEKEQGHNGAWAYELKLAHRDFADGRTVSVDADEIVDARIVQ